MSRSFTIITAILLLAIAATILAQSSHSSWAQAVRSESKTYRVTHPTSPPTSGNPFGVDAPAVQYAQSPQTKHPDSMGADIGAKMGGVMGAMVGEMMMGDGTEDTMMGSGIPPSGGGGSGGMMESGMEDAAMMEGGMGGYGGMMDGSPGGTVPVQVQLRREASRLRQAKTVEAKERSKKALEALLGNYFDSDMKRRQAELDAVKQRVAKLEALFKKRPAAKDEIIELQLKMTVNESEGLGFFSQPTRELSGGYEMGGEGHGMDGGMGGGYGMESSQHEEMGDYGMMMGGERMGGYPGGAIPIQMQLRREASRLRQAKTVEAKERSKKALETLFSDYFDNDMRRRQAELNQVKQQVARLEALFEKRQAAKKEIVELQLKMTVNESEGLGLFSKPAPGSFDGGYGGGFGMGMDAKEAGSSKMMGGYGGGSHGYGGGSGYGSEMYGSEMATPE